MQRHQDTQPPPLSRPGRSDRPRGPIACGLSVASIGPRSTLPHRQGGAPTDESVDDPVYPIFPNGVEYILARYLFPLFFFPGIEMPSQSASPQEPCYSQNLAEPETPPLWLRQCHCCASRLRLQYTSLAERLVNSPRDPPAEHIPTYRPPANHPLNRRKKNR